MRSKPPAKTPIYESPNVDAKDDPYMQLTTAYEYIRRGGKAEDFVNFEYKKYPFHIEHWDPESPNYVESPREEHRLKCSLNDHNDALDQFKRDLKLQIQVMEAIQTLDRPYLSEGTPGIDKNVYDAVKDYRDQKDLEPTLIDGNNEMNSYLQNEKAFINNTPFAVKVPKLSNEIEMEELQANAPVTDHFHPDKGYKFDVETPYDERYPHVADRLGHPEIFLNPVESLLRIETDMAHPAHLDQPFIQTPKAEPNTDLDFSAGEVIYEHPNSQEWIKFAFLNTNIACAYFGILYPIMTIFNSSAPLPFAQEESQVPPFKMMFTNFDYNGVLPIIYSAAVAATFGVSNALLKQFCQPYITRMQYNRTKDLVFITSSDYFGRTKEEVFETDHLEVLPPDLKWSSDYFGDFNSGFTTINCLNSQRIFKVDNRTEFWNGEAKKEFYGTVTRLWDQSYWEKEHMAKE